MAGLDLGCPKCETVMGKVHTAGVTLDRCGGCGAVWFDAKELEALQKNKHAAEQLDVGPLVRTDHKIRTKNLDCPRDATRMKEIVYPDQSHILVMECPMCGGRLLDAGEWKDVALFTLAERIKSFFS